MNIELRFPVLALAALALLSACTPVDEGMGSSVRTNLAIQTIDPDPAYANSAVVAGDKAGIAVERYRTDTVKKPTGISTTSAGAGSSGSGAGAGTGAR